MGRLDGKVAIVTGASRGIGQAIALDLASHGATVVVNYRYSEHEANAVADKIREMGSTCMVVQANVGDRTESRAMVKQAHEAYGRIDILVNNAGITRDRSLRKMNDDDWETVIAMNLHSCYYMTSAVMPIMIEQNFGRIVNISSMNGQTSAFGQANYGASKGGIIAFTKTAALELAKYNITVNVVAPGFTHTDMFAKVPESVQTQIKSRIPMGRFGEPEEMARAVSFLVLDGDYITGQQINVNGGAYM